MPTLKKTEKDEVPLSDESQDASVKLPLDTDDNDVPHADASGDSEDETPTENQAPETWHEGEV